MTKEELIEKLKALEEDAPSEESHLDADALLLEFIGDEDVAQAFWAIKKWYA